MRKAVAAWLVGMLVLAPLGATAQAQPRTAQVPQLPPSGTAEQQAAAPKPTERNTTASTELEIPVSLKRIRRELRETPPTQTAGLRYHFHVDVVGNNPRVDFFKDFDLSPQGAVQYGGMTHQEFLNVVTPQAFRAPSGDLLSLAVLALQKLSKKK